MKNIVRAGTCCLALLAVHGLAAAAIDEDVARELVHKSGQWSQLASIGAQVKSGMDFAAQNGHDKLEPEQRKQLQSCAEGAYAVDPMRVTAVQAVAGAVAAADLPALQAWYDSAAGRKATALEEASSALTGDPRERLQAGIEKLGAAGPARKAALQAILDNTQGAAHMVDVMIEVTLAVQQGVASADPHAAMPGAGEMRSVLEQQRPQLTARYAQLLMPLFAFTYAGLDDADLQHYAEFLGTPAGVAYNEASVRGTSRALRTGSVQLGRCIQQARTTHGS